MKSFTNILRWVLVLPASTLALFGIPFLYTLAMTHLSFILGYDSDLNRFVYGIIFYICSGYFAVLVASKIAPSYKWEACIVVSTLITIIIGGIELFAIICKEWTIYGTASALLIIIGAWMSVAGNRKQLLDDYIENKRQKQNRGSRFNYSGDEINKEHSENY